MEEPVSRAGRRRTLVSAVALGSLLIASTALACARRPPPSADLPQRPAPDLTGRAVMVLPVQTGGLAARSAGAALDSELAYWLSERGTGIRWTFPPALEDALRRSPGLDIRLDALAVSSFLRAEVRNIGDPLFGDLRRLGALVDARYALLPVKADYVAGADGAGRAELSAAIIDTLGGRVLWFGIVAGEPGARDEPAVTATVARALARTVAR